MIYVQNRIFFEVAKKLGLKQILLTEDTILFIYVVL